MASVFKAQSAKGKGKARAPTDDAGAASTSTAPVAKRARTSTGSRKDQSDKGVNGAEDSEGVKEKEARRKDKVLMLSSRGVTQRMRHLMHDFEALLPHLKKDSKLDSKSSIHLINELADLHSCNNALYFEARRHEDLYLWLSRSPNGPSAKCHVQNVHTMDELKMTGNCLKGSRGLVVFDGAWDGEEWGGLMKEMLTHVSESYRKMSRGKSVSLFVE